MAGRARVRRVVAGSVTVLAACGQRSLSCYLGQSVLFVALLPAWTLGLGARLTVAQAALLAVGVWLVLLLAAVVGGPRRRYRGPAETCCAGSPTARATRAVGDADQALLHRA